MDDTKITTPGAARLRTGAGSTRRRIARMLGALASGLLAALALGAPAHAALTAAGPVVPRHGFPEYYQDASGLRLALCVENDDPFCTNVAPNPGPATVSSDPAQTNLPDETFYWSADALIDKRSVGVRARLVMAQEAGFFNGTPAAGDQMTFGRIRVRIDGAKPNAKYTVVHPYGNEHLTADKRGRVSFTDDVGCAAAPCDFNDALATRIGPFLRWDPKTPPAAPAGAVPAAGAGRPAAAAVVVAVPCVAAALPSTVNRCVSIELSPGPPMSGPVTRNTLNAAPRGLPTTVCSRSGLPT